MNEQIIAKNVIMKHIFSKLSILCEKLPLESKTKIARTIPIITIGAIIVECNTVARMPTTMTPMATNAVK
jgi:hypothetical protein